MESVMVYGILRAISTVLKSVVEVRTLAAGPHARTVRVVLPRVRRLGDVSGLLTSWAPNPGDLPLLAPAFFTVSDTGTAKNHLRTS